MKRTICIRKTVGFTALVAAALATTAGCDARKATGSEKLSPGIVIEQSGMIALQNQMANVVTAVPPMGLKGGGLFGIIGGARVKILKAGEHEILLPMPQLTEGQAPVCYAVMTAPPEGGKEYRIRERGESNVVVSVQLRGNRDQEIQINWASVVLVANGPLAPDRGLPESYLRETACVQSGAAQIRTLADKLWPTDGSTDEYAASIQKFIRGMTQKKQPRSMDALGILDSGGNWICTANANLAAALLRSKSIPARSLAVIPPTAQHLEMHRIVEYFDGNQWRGFDPSSLQKDIPTKPWQNIVMVRTTIADENIAMTPRMGTSLGCPYGQELEFLQGASTLWGKDFFWTMGKPLVEFEASAEAINLVRAEWGRFLETGKLSQRQIRAAAASDPAAFLEALRTK
jgi:hypothetical protein